jgi:hypothetical protein
MKRTDLPLLMLICGIVLGLLEGNANAQSFKAPQISISPWNGDTSTKVTITIIDSSDREIGYRIQREMNFPSSFSLIKDEVSATPSLIGDTIRYVDNSISFNTWYRYTVSVYDNVTSRVSTPCTTFTLRYTPPPQPRQAVRFIKLSDFQVADSGGWSALAGDSIIYKDTAGLYAVINITNPSNPVSSGYIDSIRLMSYPQKTLIPAFLSFGVTDNYANTQAVRGEGYFANSIIIAKDSIVRMTSIGSPLTITGDGNNNLILMPLNDSLFAVQTDAFNNSGKITINYIFVNILPSGGFSSKTVNVLQTLFYEEKLVGIGSPVRWHRLRPYVDGSLDRNIMISCDKFESEYRAGADALNTYTYYRQTYNFVNGAMDSTPLNAPCADAYNTCRSISSTRVLCTNGFPYSSSGFKPGDVPTELFAADIDDPHPHATASALGGIYRDTIHKQNQIQNIILDTLKKRVYLIFTDNMSILSYQNVMVGTGSRDKKPCFSNGLRVLPCSFSSGVTIVLPDRSAETPADLYFYDLSGRMIDRMRGVTAHAVIWKPWAASKSCYIIRIKTEGRSYTQKFMIR